MNRGFASVAGMQCCTQTTRALLTTQVQAMRKLNQPAVIVKAREVDVSIVQGVLDGARSKYKQTYSSDAPTVTMAESYLPGPPSGGLTVGEPCAPIGQRCAQHSARTADNAAIPPQTAHCIFKAHNFFNAAYVVG